MFFLSHKSLVIKVLLCTLTFHSKRAFGLFLSFFTLKPNMMKKTKIMFAPY